MAFETLRPPERGRRFVLPEPAYVPLCHPFGNYFYSTAHLENIERIQPCRANAMCITGLLLHYQDKHQEVIGYIQPSGLEPAIAIDGWFGLGLERVDGYCQVIEASVSPLEATTMLTLKCEGSLEWWWMARPRQAHIVYGDQRTPPFRL